MIKGIKEKEDFGFIGLKRHTHEGRQKVIEQILPTIEKLLGDNLLAVAAQASYARKEDTDFSDLELVIFIKGKVEGMKRGFSRVIDGMLIESVFMTEDEYINDTLEITDHWYISGSDVLEPITNPNFFERIKQFKPERKEEKCIAIARGMMHNVQEEFGKLFTAIEQENRDGLFMMFANTVKFVLLLMAYINATPYKTLSQFMPQAKSFKVKPDGFDEFIQIAIDGDYQDLEKLKRSAIKLFGNIEKFFMENGGKIYDDNLELI